MHQEKVKMTARFSIKGLAFSTAVIAFATAVCAAVQSFVEISDLTMIYLAGIAYIAARATFYEAAVSSALAVALLDFLFVPPRFTFAVSHGHFFVTLAVMFVISIVISNLTSRLRQQSKVLSDREMGIEREKVRNSLLSSLSHDLRTPLSSISGAASGLLQEEELSSENRRELALTISEEADRLSRMIRNILDITRLESGELNLKKEWNSLEELISTALERTRRLLGKREVRISIPEGFPLIEVDGLLFEQVLINILENSAKHTGEETEISIAAKNDDNWIHVLIENNGPSLVSGTEEMIFEKNFRRSSAHGFGLGLFISRTIVRAHSGEITAGNRTGGGVVFDIRLPSSLPPEIEAITNE